MNKSSAFCVALFVLVAGCTREAQKAAIHASDAACEIVNLATDNPIPETLCLVEREIGDALEKVIDAQKKGADSVPLEVSAPSGVRRFRIVQLPSAETELRRAKVRISRPLHIKDKDP